MEINSRNPYEISCEKANSEVEREDYWR